MLRLLLPLLAITVIAQNSQAISFDESVPENTKTQLLDDLKFMGTVKGQNTTDLHKQVYGDMDGAHYVNWFESRVLSVSFDSNGPQGAVAYVSPFFNPNEMVLTQNYVQFDHPQVARLMVVYHEARHTESEGGHYMHATCPTPFLDADGKEIRSIWTGGPLAGQDGCDSNVVGAYASTVVLLGNVEKNCESCSEKVKMDAGLYSRDQLRRVTNLRAKSDIEKDLNLPASLGW